MLELNSVGQILRVLGLYRQNRRLGFDTAAACSRAIEQVAREANVRYQTIGDGCRRRLGLVDMNQFHRLAEDWLNGNHAPLVAVLRKNSTGSAAPRISEFFAENQAALKPARTLIAASVTGGVKEGRATPIKVIIDNADARMLRVLADLEGREPADTAVDLLRVGMRDRLRAALA